MQLLLSEAADPLAAWLDARLGHTVTDNAVFSALPRRFEAEFHDDMQALNVSSAFRMCAKLAYFGCIVLPEVVGGKFSRTIYS